MQNAKLGIFDNQTLFLLLPVNTLDELGAKITLQGSYNVDFDRMIFPESQTQGF